MFGEILKRRPILLGSDDLDQLDKIFQLCGTPTAQSWPKMKDLPGMQSIAKFERSYPRSIEQKFQQLSFFFVWFLERDGLFVCASLFIGEGGFSSKIVL